MNTFYSKSKAESIFHDTDIDSIFESIYSTIITKQKHQAEDSSWTIDSVIVQNIHVSKYKPLCGSSYNKFPEEWNHSRNGFINIQNTHENKCLKLKGLLNKLGWFKFVVTLAFKFKKQ